MAVEASYLSVGVSVPYTPVGAVAVGEIVEVGEFVGVADRPIAAGVLGALTVEGTYRVKKDETVAFAVGDKVFWDAAANEANDDIAEKYFGIAISVELAAATHVDLRIQQPAA